VHGIVLARVPRSEADDLVQEVFLLAMQRMHALREAAAFPGWLASIARNRATDYLRGARPVSELRDDTLVQRSLPAEALEAMDAIRSLPEAYRETLMLRLVEGMTGPEIAERTGLTHDSVRVNLHRGMKMLREKLDGHG
jgi:RNA polymerase sigma-70 factor (ECF subfamily)